MSGKRRSSSSVDDTCILIPSCDNFADAHSPFMACFEKYWPDCPWKMYGLSESGWGHNRLACGNDNGWAMNLINGLEQISEEYVMMFLEDMFLCDPVNQSKLDVARRAIADNLVGAVRVGPGAETCDEIHGDNLGCISRDSMYRISTSPTIWRRDFLLFTLRGPRINSAWDFEITGTKQSVAPNGKRIMKLIDHPVLVLYTAITRGFWEEGALNWLRRVGIEVETDRPVKGYEPGQRWPKVEE